MTVVKNRYRSVKVGSQGITPHSYRSAWAELSANNGYRNDSACNCAQFSAKMCERQATEMTYER
jgi:hypothetical protein